VPILFSQDVIEVDWQRAQDRSINYLVKSPIDIWIHAAGHDHPIHVRAGRGSTTLRIAE
jgi:hypothetical protein